MKEITKIEMVDYFPKSQDAFRGPKEEFTLIFFYFEKIASKAQDRPQEYIHDHGDTFSLPIPTPGSWIFIYPILYGTKYTGKARLYCLLKLLSTSNRVFIFTSKDWQSQNLFGSSIDS